MTRERAAPERERTARFGERCGTDRSRLSGLDRLPCAACGGCSRRGCLLGGLARGFDRRGLKHGPSRRSHTPGVGGTTQAPPLRRRSGGCGGRSGRRSCWPGRRTRGSDRRGLRHGPTRCSHAPGVGGAAQAPPLRRSGGGSSGRRRCAGGDARRAGRTLGRRRTVRHATTRSGRRRAHPALRRNSLRSRCSLRRSARRGRGDTYPARAPRRPRWAGLHAGGAARRRCARRSARCGGGNACPTLAGSGSTRWGTRRGPGCRRLRRGSGQTHAPGPARGLRTARRRLSRGRPGRARLGRIGSRSWTDRLAARCG
jgi:hypothetical protein